jgi:hypothetical protein
MGARFRDSVHFYPASCIPRVRVFRRRVPGTGFQVPGTWHGTRGRINAEDRTPGTEDRAWPLPSLHPVSCIPFLTEHYRDCG